MKILGIATLAGALASLAGGAGAGILEIGLQEAGVNGGALTAVASGTSGSLALAGLTYGSFIVDASALGVTNPGALVSNAINTSTGTAGVLMIAISLQGVTQPTGAAYFSTGLTTNEIPAGWTVVETSYLSPNNALFEMTTLVDRETFTSIGAISLDPYVYIGPGPYSLTETYTITATMNGGTTNDTIDLSDPPPPVPEPSALALLGSGMLLLGFLRRAAAKSGR